MLASTPDEIDEDAFHRRMLRYAGTVVLVGPLLARALLVLAGWW